VITREEIASLKMPRIRKMNIHSRFKNYMNEKSINEDSFLKKAKQKDMSDNYEMEIFDSEFTS
jgi:hypothetical protein